MTLLNETEQHFSKSKSKFCKVIKKKKMTGGAVRVMFVKNANAAVSGAETLFLNLYTYLAGYGIQIRALMA